MSATTRPTVVIVGAGLMGGWHADAARRAGARIAGIADTDLQRATLLAQRHRGARPATHLHELLSNGPVDIVHICTPLETHVDLGSTAIAAGSHVLMEKPLTSDADSAQRLFRAAAELGRLVAPVHQFLFQRGALFALRRLDAIGPLRHLEMEICSAGATPTAASRDSVAIEILPHALALAAHFCRTPITEGSWDIHRPAAGEIVVSAAVGAVGVTARVSMRGRPPVNRLRLVGERGTIHLDLFHGFAVVEGTSTSRAMKIARPFLLSARLGAAATRNLVVRAFNREPAYPGLRELVRRFYAAIAGRAPNPIPVDKSLAVMVVWDLLRRRLGSSEPADRPLEESGLER